MSTEHLRNKLLLVHDINIRQTRQAENIAIQLRKTNNAQKSLFYQGAIMYNALPLQIRRCNGILSFKRMLKVFILRNVPRF